MSGVSDLLGVLGDDVGTFSPERRCGVACADIYDFSCFVSSTRNLFSVMVLSSFISVLINSSEITVKFHVFDPFRGIARNFFSIFVFLLMFC